MLMSVRTRSLALACMCVTESAPCPLPLVYLRTVTKREYLHAVLRCGGEGVIASGWKEHSPGIFPKHKAFGCQSVSMRSEKTRTC